MNTQLCWIKPLIQWKLYNIYGWYTHHISSLAFVLSLNNTSHVIWCTELCYIESQLQTTWAPSQYKDRLSRYGDSHVKDKTVTRLGKYFEIVSNNIDTNTSQIEFEGYNPCAYLIDRLSENHNISESWKIKRYLSWIYTQATKRP